MKRRQFLNLIPVLLAASRTPWALMCQRQLLVLGSGIRRAYKGPSDLVESEPGFVHLLDSVSSRKIEVPFLPHGFSQSEKNPHLIATSLKWGRHAAIISTDAYRPLRVFEARPQTRYFGHSCFSPDGRFVLFSMQNDQTLAGEIEIRRTDDFEIEKIVPSFGYGPHEIAFDHESSHLITTNTQFAAGQERPMVWIDLKTQTIKKAIQLLPEQKGSMIHFLKTQNGFFGVGPTLGKAGEKNNGFIYQIKAGSSQPVLVPGSSEKTLGETLSIVDDIYGGLFYVTVPDVDRILGVSPSSGRILRELDIESPQGAALFLGSPTFSSKTNGRIYKLNPKTGQLEIFLKVHLEEGHQLSSHMISVLSS